MSVADEMLEIGGTPYDLSCYGIKLQVQNAVHMFSIFRITARGVFFPICVYILWIILQVFVVFSTYFPFLADFQVPLNRLFLCYSTFNFEFCFM